MKASETLLKKLNQLPAAKPDAWEKDATRDYKASAFNPEENELVSLEALKERVKRASGRISIRVPKQLHADLINAAEENGVSLNQYISYLLSSGTRR